MHTVLDGKLDHSQLQKAVLRSVDTTIGSHRADWVTLSLEEVLIFLIEESANFKLMEDALRRAGAHHAQFLHRCTSSPAVTTAHEAQACRCPSQFLFGYIEPSDDNRSAQWRQPLACCTFGILGCYIANAVYTTGPKLRLVLYSDGITPGNVLSSDKRRKSAAWYASFLEFGRCLAFEEAWLPFAFAWTARSLNFLKGDRRTR